MRVCLMKIKYKQKLKKKTFGESRPTPTILRLIPILYTLTIVS